MIRLGFDVRRLAALDTALHGTRLVVAEFPAGDEPELTLLGALSLASGVRLLPDGPSWQLLLGVVLVCAGINYVPLLLHAIDLARRGSARDEAAAELADLRLARGYTVRQLWLLVPFAVVAMAVAQRPGR